MEDKTTLIRRRGQVKGKLTNFMKYLQEWEPGVGVRKLQLRLSKFEESCKEFNEIQEKIELLDDSEAQRLEATNFENAYFDIVDKAYELIESQELTTPPSPVSVVSVSQPASAAVALPKIQITPFSGDYTEWLSFQDLFKSVIDNNVKLTQVQKLYYLKSCLQGPAAKLIQSIPLLEDNYKVAWETLEERYSNKPLLINQLVQGLYQQPTLERESVASLRGLLETTMRNVQALKVLGQSVDSWDTLLVHLVASKLDPVTLRAWQLENKSQVLPKFEEMTKFIAHRCQVLETLQDVKSVRQKSITQHKYSPQSSKTSKYVSTKQTFVSTVSTCNLCKDTHKLFQCEKFKQMEVEGRIQFVKQSSLCLNCLRGNHFIKDCKASNCKICGLKHNTLLHKSQVNSKQNSKANDVVQNEVSNSESNTSLIHIAKDIKCRQVLLSTALVNVQDSKGSWRTCRALLDNGSQSNFISEKLCKNLNLKVKDINLPIISISDTTTMAIHQVKINITSHDFEGYQDTLECVVLPSISGSIPNAQIDTSCINIPYHITLADPDFDIPAPVDILLGASAFWDILQGGVISLGSNCPTLRQTKLGWICTGTLFTNEKANKSICQLNTSCNIDCIMQQFWKIEEIDSCSKYTPEEFKCEQLYEQTVRRDSEGRYIVSLPRKENVSSLGNSKSIALRRMYALESKLSKQPNIREKYYKERVGCRKQQEAIAPIHP